jgi:hypothetical protein
MTVALSVTRFPARSCLSSCALALGFVYSSFMTFDHRKDDGVRIWQNDHPSVDDVDGWTDDHRSIHTCNGTCVRWPRSSGQPLAIA